MAKPWGDMNMDLPGYCSKICKFIQLNLYTLITAMANLLGDMGLYIPDSSDPDIIIIVQQYY